MNMYDAFTYVDLTTTHQAPQWMSDKCYQLFEKKASRSLIARLLLAAMF